jgi:F-type H+-transporting ATPase subunit alpha
VEVLKQPQYQPLTVEKQVIIIYAATNGYLDPVPVESVRAYETELFRFLDTRRGQLLSALADKKQIDDAVKKDLNQALEEFGKDFAAAQKKVA